MCQQTDMGRFALVVESVTCFSIMSLFLGGHRDSFKGIGHQDALVPLGSSL